MRRLALVDLDQARLVRLADAEAHGDQRQPGPRRRVDVLDAGDAPQRARSGPRSGSRPRRLGARPGHHHVDHRHADLRLLLARCGEQRERAEPERRDDQERRELAVEKGVGEPACESDAHAALGLGDRVAVDEPGRARAPRARPARDRRAPRRSAVARARGDPAQAGAAVADDEDADQAAAREERGRGNRESGLRGDAGDEQAREESRSQSRPPRAGRPSPRSGASPGRRPARWRSPWPASGSGWPSTSTLHLRAGRRRRGDLRTRPSRAARSRPRPRSRSAACPGRRRRRGRPGARRRAPRTARAGPRRTGCPSPPATWARAPLAAAVISSISRGVAAPFSSERPVRSRSASAAATAGLGGRERRAQRLVVEPHHDAPAATRSPSW